MDSLGDSSDSILYGNGLYTVKKNTAAQVTTEIQPAKKTGSLPEKGNKGRKRKEGRKENTEAEKSRSKWKRPKSRFCEAQAAVKKVKDATQKQSYPIHC